MSARNLMMEYVVLLSKPVLISSKNKTCTRDGLIVA